MFISMQRSVHFGPSAGSGPREVIDTLFFPRPVREIITGLAGYSVSFPGSADGRPFGRLVVDVGKPEFTGKEAQVVCRFGLRDWSGDWDDAYAGVIDYIVYAELEDDESVGEEVTINGVEYNQAIQFFRSHLDLDTMTQQPDNAIPLIAGKPTAIRVYADYNPPGGAAAGLTEYRGELEVRSAGRTEIITTLAQYPNLSPRRDTHDAPVSKADVPHFPIPAELCTGDVTVRGRLRVHNLETGVNSNWSAFFERHLRFFRDDGLTVHLVGLRVVGEQSPARAPTREEAEALFGETRSMFPIGELTISGFTVVEIVLSTSDAIRDLLVLMKGDSNDIHFALFSEDFEGTLTGSEGKAINGQAWSDHSVAWSAPDQTDVAHEMGHLFGRDHVNTGNGENGPYDVLPTYGSYPRGSIGQHGVNTMTNLVLEPEAYADVMTYKLRKWISAYSYAAFLPQIDNPFGQHLTRPPREARSEVLFLALTIGRDRRVVRHPSFHFPAPMRQAPIARSGFTLELADECRNALVCWPLNTGVVPEYCWPKTYSAEAPYPPAAKWLLVWEGDRLLYEECIPAPPRLDLSCTATPAGVQLSWAGEPEEDLWHLVQWRDIDGTWRGLPPRTQQTHALVPRALFRQQASVRVLVTSGIATAAATCTLALPPRPRDLTIAVTELRRPDRRPSGSSVAGWRAFAYDEGGRSLTRAAFRWFDETGREIHAGATLPLSAIGDETHEVTAVLRDQHGAAGPVRRTWCVCGRGRDRTLKDPTSSPTYAHGG